MSCTQETTLSGLNVEQGFVVFSPKTLLIRDERGAPKKLRCSFIQDECGGITIFVLILSVLMLVAGGMAVDFQRQELARADLQNALDRGVLAATDSNQCPVSGEFAVRPSVNNIPLPELLNADLAVVRCRRAPGADRGSGRQDRRDRRTAAAAIRSHRAASADRGAGRRNRRDR